MFRTAPPIIQRLQPLAPLVVAFGSLLLLARPAAAEPIELPVNTWVPVSPAEGKANPDHGGDVRWSYDEHNDQFVMFGGDGVRNCEAANCESGSYRRTTWVYSLRSNTWHNTVPHNSPAGYPGRRCQPAMVFDPVRHVTYMRNFISSISSDEEKALGYRVGEMWAYDHATTSWTHIDTQGPADHDNRWGLTRFMAYSRVHDRVFTVSTSQWADTNVFMFDPQTLVWTAMPRNGQRPDLHRSAMPSPPLVFDDSIDRLIALFRVPEKDGVPESCETWLYSFSTNTWEMSTSMPRPDVCNLYMGFVHDTANQVSIVFGAGKNKDQTWVYNAHTDKWQQMHPAVSPSGRQQFAMAYSTQDNAVALWGNEEHWYDPHPVWLYRYAECEGACGVPDAGTGPGGPGPDGGPGAGVTDNSMAGCGCQSSGGAGSLGWLVIGALLLVRRRAVGGTTAFPRALLIVAVLSLASAGCDREHAATPTADAATSVSPVDAGARTVTVTTLPWSEGLMTAPGKHTKVVQSPDTGRMYFMGGDFSAGNRPQSYRQDGYSVDPMKRDWRQDYSYCPPEDGVVPLGPDMVGWVYAGRPNELLMVGGMQLLAAGNDCPGVRGMAMTYNVQTRTWSVVPGQNKLSSVISSTVTDNLPTFWTYDPITDAVYALGFEGEVIQFDMKTAQFSRLRGNPFSVRVSPNKKYVPLVDRELVLVDDLAQAILAWNIDTGENRVVNAEVPFKVGHENTFVVYLPWLNALFLHNFRPTLVPTDSTSWLYHFESDSYEELELRDDKDRVVRSRMLGVDLISQQVLMGAHTDYEKWDSPKDPAWLIKIE